MAPHVYTHVEVKLLMNGTVQVGTVNSTHIVTYYMYATLTLHIV